MTKTITKELMKTAKQSLTGLELLLPDANKLVKVNKEVETSELTNLELEELRAAIQIENNSLNAVIQSQEDYNRLKDHADSIWELDHMLSLESSGRWKSMSSEERDAKNLRFLELAKRLEGSAGY